MSQWSFSVAMVTTVLKESAPKHKSSPSPILLMVHTKFDPDWPTDLGDSIISLLKIYSVIKGANSKERRRGRVVRAIACDAECRRFESRSGQKTGKLSLSTQQRMGT